VIRARTLTTACVAAMLVTLVAIPAGAAPRTPRPTKPACLPLTLQRSKVHTAAHNRTKTLAALESALEKRNDPWSVNGAQLTALRNASSGITALDQQIQRACYPTVAAFRADASKLLTDYRVYWLRAPQTHQIEAADHLGEASKRLHALATKLAAFAGTNAQVQADVAHMNAALAAADTALGVTPTLAANIAKVPTLQPAKDMTANVAALHAARADLKTAHTQLVAAHKAAAQAIKDLGG
jgi:hypothetical protein